jgi:hypothetical protein
LQDTGETPPEMVVVKLIKIPASIGSGLAPAVTVSSGLTVMVMLPVATTARPSVAVTMAVKLPPVV